jgi:hypothetical protein
MVEMKKIIKAKKSSKSKLLIIIFYVLILVFIILYFPTLIWHFPDGIGYYSYLPVLFGQKNYDFKPLFNLYTTNIAITNKGFVVNDFSCGSAIMWMPAYIISRIFKSGSVSIIFVNFFSSLLGIFSLFFVYNTLLLFKTEKFIAKLISLFIFLGSPLVFYSYVIPQNPHTVTAFLCSVFLYFWLSTYGQKKLTRWILLGLILGLATLVREQEVLFGICLIIELIGEVIKNKRVEKIYFKFITVFLITFLFVLTPYFLNSMIVFGNVFIPKSYTLSFTKFSLSSVLDVIFSSYHGLFWWTPVLVVGIAGLFFGLKKNFVVSVSFLLILFLQIVLISLVTAPGGGWSFGIRYLTDCSTIFAFGIYQMYSLLKNGRIKFLFLSICGILTLWTVMLVILSAKRIVDLLEPYTVKEFLTVVIKNIDNVIKIKFSPRIILDYDQYFFIVIIFVLCFSITKLLYSVIKNKVAYWIVIIGIIFAIVLFDIKMFESGVVNRVVYKNYKEFLSFNDYKNYFLLAGLKVRIKYYKKIKDEKNYQYYFEIAKNLNFETLKGKNLYIIMLSNLE